LTCRRKKARREESREEEGKREMTRAKLAEQLRQRLQEGGEIPSEALAELDDDFIVSSYLDTACEDCGKKLAEGVDVDQLLAESRDLDDFFNLCVNTKDHVHAFAHVHWPTEL
jgi:hypothetical protein